MDTESDQPEHMVISASRPLPAPTRYWRYRKAGCRDCGTRDEGDNPRGGRCRACRNALRRRKWAELPPEQRRAVGHKSHGRELGSDQFDALVAAQDGRCVICGRRPPDRTVGRPRADGTRSLASGLVYDHDHATGTGRALLCAPCNIMLGHAQDSPDLLEAGAAYLRQWASLS